MASSIDASTSGAGGVITTADNTGILQLKTAGTTAVTVDASQNVGIGTSSFSYSGSGRGLLELNGSTLSLFAMKYGNTPTFYALSSANDIELAAVGASTPMRFTVNSSERMRIDSSGNLLVNATAQISGEKFHVSAGGSTINTAYFNFTTTDDRGNVVCKHARATGATTGQQIAFLNAAGTNVGAVNSTTSATSYATSSDYRLKENIVPMTGALDKVAQLKPVTYTWKVDGKDGQGFIAHELQAVVPDAVVGEKDAVDDEGNPKYQGVDTSFLVATLTAAIQEQQTIINDLKARVTALEAK